MASDGRGIGSIKRGMPTAGKTMKPFRIVAMKATGSGEIDAAFELSRQILHMQPEAFRFCRCLQRIVRRHHRNDLSFREHREIFKPEMAFAFWDFGFWVAMALVVMAVLDPAIQL